MDARELFEVVSMIQALLLVPFIAYNVNQRSGGFDMHLGNMSYPFYLIHYPVLAAIGALVGTGDEDLAMRIFAKGTVLIVVIAVTALIYVLADRPIEKMRRGFVKRSLERAAAVTPAGSGIGD